jgi:hypothetical protein
MVCNGLKLFRKQADQEDIFHPSIFVEISRKNILISSELFWEPFQLLQVTFVF